MKRLYCILSALTLLGVGGCSVDGLAPAEMTSLSKVASLKNEKSLDASITFDVGKLEVLADSNLYSLDLDYDKANYSPSVEYESPETAGEGRLSLKLKGNKSVRMRSGPESNRMRLGLSDAIPLNLRIRTGVGDARLSLSKLQLSKLELEAGVGGARITSYDPNSIVCDSVRLRNGVGGFEAVGLGNLNFRDLDFEGGVGGASLDFTGEWRQDAEVKIQVGVGGVTVRMPRDVGVEVDAEKHFLSGFHLSGFVKRDSRYYSENYDKAKIRISMRVATGIGGFRFSWI